MRKLLILFLFLFALCHGEDHSYSIPVDGKHLKIQIPSNFKFDSNELVVGAKTTHYIPNNENEEHCSEKISVFKIPDCRQLLSLVSTVRNMNSESYDPKKILEDSLNFTKENGVLVATHSFDHFVGFDDEAPSEQKGEVNEIKIEKYYQTGEDAWQISYKARYCSNENSLKPKSKIIEKMDDFFTNNVGVK